jgi:ATP-dependent Clp protease ATP-binding subunit ClpA/ATP-dependent Clp protease ATP-binding subunit ClpC
MELRVTVFTRRSGRQLQWHTVGLGKDEQHLRGANGARLHQRLADALRKRVSKLWPEQVRALESPRGRKLEVLKLEMNLGTGGSRTRFRADVPLIIEPRTRGPAAEGELVVVYHPLRADEWFVHEPDRDLVEEAQIFFRRRWQDFDQGVLETLEADPKDRMRLVAVTVYPKRLSEKLTEKKPDPFAFLGAPSHDKGESLLGRLGTNETLAATEGTLAVGMPRSPYREQLELLLCGTDKAPVVLIGDAGVGKSTIIRHAVADLLRAENFASHRNLDRVHKVWQIRGRRIIAGMSYLGQWEQRCVDIVEACREHKGILWVDDLAAWGRIGESRESERSLATFFRGPLSRRELIMIGECTPQGWQQLQDDAPGLAAALTTIVVEPTTRAETMRMLIHESRRLEREHGVSFDPRGFRTIYELGGSLLSNTSYPGKALELLRVLGSGEYGMSADLRSVELALQNRGKIPAIKRYRELIHCGLKQAKDAVEAFMERGVWPPIQSMIKASIPSPDSLLSDPYPGRHGGPELGPRQVIRLLARRTGMPELLLSPERSVRAEDVEQAFTRQIMGQPAAVAAMRDLVVRIKAGLNDAGRPFGVYLFTGPTGTGKTEMAKCLAEYLYGDESRLVRFDMSEMTGPDAPARLIGDRFQPEGALTGKVRSQPFCVVLLDEIEKASPAVLNLMLQLFDDGRLTDASGTVVDFTHTVVIMTSNLGAKATPSVGFGDEGAAGDQEIDAAVREFFPPELFNRIDHVVRYSALPREAARLIARRELEKLLDRRGLTERNVFVRFTPSVVELAVAEGFNPRDGARSLKRWLEDHVGAFLADEISGRAAAAVRVFWLYIRDGRLQLRGEHLQEATALPEPSALEELVGWNAGRLRAEVPAALERAEALADSDALQRLADAVRSGLRPSTGGDVSTAEAVFNIERLRGEVLDIVELLRTQAAYDPLLADQGDLEARAEWEGELSEATDWATIPRRTGHPGGSVEVQIKNLDPRFITPDLPLQNRPALLDALGSLFFLEHAIEVAAEPQRHAVIIELTRMSRSSGAGRFQRQAPGLLEWLAEAYADARGDVEQLVVEDGTGRLRKLGRSARLGESYRQVALRIVGPAVRSFFEGDHGTHVRESLAGGTEIVRVRVLPAFGESGPVTAMDHLASQGQARDAFVEALEAGREDAMPANPDAVLPILRRYRFEPRGGDPAPIDVEDYRLSHVTSTRARRLADVLPTLWLLRLGADGRGEHEG